MIKCPATYIVALVGGGSQIWSGVAHLIAPIQWAYIITLHGLGGAYISRNTAIGVVRALWRNRTEEMNIKYIYAIIYLVSFKIITIAKLYL